MSDKIALKWIKERTKGERWKLVLLIFLHVIFSVITVAFAFAMKTLISGAINYANKEDGETQIIIGAVSLVSIIILQFVLRILINGLTEHLHARLEMKYKSYIFGQILDKKFNKISAFHSGKLMNNINNDVSVVSDAVVSILPTLIAGVVRLGCAIAALIYLDWIFAIAFSVAGILVFSIIALLRGKLKKLHKITQETEGQTRSFMQECIENLLAVKVFSVNKKIHKKADKLQQENFNVKMKRKNYSVLGHATYNLIFSAGYVFALIYGGIKIFNGLLGYDDLTAILQLVNNVQVPFASLSNVVPKYFSMCASAERLIDIESIEDEMQEEYKNRDEIYAKMQSIDFVDVSYSYDRDIILKGVNFSIKKGEFVAMQGVSGAGKSTFLKLLLGIYNVNDGKILVRLDDGEMELDGSFRKIFSYVPQGNMIFSGTILDNLLFASDSDEENVQQIDEALRISGADVFIKEFPNGLNTVIGENGIGLSEGQAQRIAIARAILTKAPFIILDEATSALDEGTEKKVLDNLKALQNKTVLIVSHKKAAFDVCEKRVKISNKNIVEF